MMLARGPLADGSHAPPSLRCRRRTARGVALLLATLAGSAPPTAGAQVTERPPATSHPVDAERAGRIMTGGALLMGASALVGALAVWQWADPGSYEEFMLGDDPGPLIDPSVLLTPAWSIGLAGFGGAGVVRGVALHRGAAPEVPWTYWLPLAPAAVTLGTEALFLARHEPPPPEARALVAAGTAASVLGFWASTALHGARVDGPGAAAPPDRAAFAVVPVLGLRGGGPRLGVAVRGDF